VRRSGWGTGKTLESKKGCKTTGGNTGKKSIKAGEKRKNNKQKTKTEKIREGSEGEK